MANNDPNWRDDPHDEELRKFDRFAHAVTVITEPHRNTHEGFMFHASGRASVANGANLDLLLAVPAGVFPHLQKALITLADSPCDVKTYEGVTTSDDGAAVVEFCTNRNSSNTPGTVMTTGPTVSDLGTLIHDRFVPDQGGTGSNDVGAITENAGEAWVFAPSTKYLVRTTNNSGATIVMSWEVQWYEMDYIS